MPIFEIVFSSPLPIALTRFRAASSAPSGRSPRRRRCADAARSSTSSSTVSNIRYGLTRSRRSRSASRCGGPRAARRTRATMPARRRVPSRTRWWWTAATASNDGIGTRARADRAVGEDDDVDALRRSPRGPRRRCARAPSSIPAGPSSTRPGDVDRVRLEDVVGDVAQRLELVVEQDRLVEHELVGVLGRLVEQVALAAERGRRGSSRCPRGSGRSAGW